ncbi:MAG: DUF4892 domain-containing protein [Halioglobus sp.]
MTGLMPGRWLWSLTLLVGASLSTAAVGDEFGPATFFERVTSSPHLELIAESEASVADHEIGLGALKKIRGVWGFRASERLSGELSTRTWQVLDGFTSQEVLADVEQSLAETPGAELLFTCDGRACGAGAQWASRVFNERLLYGRADLQRYRVFRIPSGESVAEGESVAQLTVILYAAARSSERQYLHSEVLVSGE